MISPSSTCARHPEAIASFTCGRCGGFGCVDCERRATVDGAPVCPSCWARQAPAPTSEALQTAGLVVGLLSIVPCCPLAIASLILNIVALVKATKESRWKPIVGLVVTLAVGLLQTLFIVFYQVFQRP
jgi:hypothetical protein